MRHFEISYDINITKDLLNMTNESLANKLGVSRVTLNKWIKNPDTMPNSKIADFYEMAFGNKVYLNKIKEQFYREEYSGENHKILFHGAKTFIEEPLSLDRSRLNNDFGKGFYCGESLEQSTMFVSNFPESTLYIMDFDTKGLKYKSFGVDREWMLTIAYFRGHLEEYKNSLVINELINSLEGMDYIIAPIADNRIFELIDSFIEGEITDIQCQHCLSATNLGNQYVFMSDKALKQVKLLEHCYLAQSEKMYYLESRNEFANINRDKVKIARKKYRGQGKYIEEILE